MDNYIPQLRLAREFIALEAATFPDVQALLTNVFPRMLSGFSGFANHFMPEAPAISVSPRYRDFIKEIGKHQYVDLIALGVFVPEGLDVPYITYLQALKPAVDHA